MIGAILNFIFIIILGVIIIAGVIVFRIYRSLHNVSKQFRSFQGNAKGNGTYGNGRRTDSREDTIVDRRTPDEANRKIFSKSEGEYVDFEEEK